MSHTHYFKDEPMNVCTKIEGYIFKSCADIRRVTCPRCVLWAIFDEAKAAEDARDFILWVQDLAKR